MEAWAQLVCVTDTETPPFEINKSKFTIGRARGNDISLFDNKLVSGQHCYLEKDEMGKAWIYDTSTNGTLLNMTEKLTKNECRQLQHGDEFYVVYKKNNMELNVGYMFQDLAELAREQESDVDETQEYSDLPNPDATIVDEELNVADSPEVKKRPHSDSLTDKNSEPAVKKQKSSDGAEADVTLDKSQVLTDPDRKKKDEETGKEIKAEDACPEKPAETKKDTETPVTDAAKKKDTETPVTDAAKKDTETPVTDAAKKDTETPVTDAAKKKLEVDESDAMAETLVCIICQEILHDCISLQPCMHSFCAGCYSDWMERSQECPSCRLEVERINKNHIVNNLVEAYLKEHPERKRPEEDIKELDAKNKITRDMLYPKKKRHICEEDSSEEYTDSEEDAPPPSIPTTFTIPQPATGGTIFGFGTPLFGTVRPPKTVCRQCAEYKEPGTGLVGGIKTAIDTVKNFVTGAGVAGGDNPGPSGGDNPGTAATPADGAGPSTSGEGDKKDDDEKMMPTPPAFTCAVNQNHVLCQCCLQPMPDRRIERARNPELPPQQCIVCFRAFCHAYWGCRNVNCLGCIGKFKDMNFGKKSLPNLILDNASESTIFKDYIEANNISVRDVLKVSLAKLESGEYKCFDQMRYRIDGNTVFCYTCGMRNFKDLAYQYRKDIPRDKLPEAVQRRPDCYWGKNCRTQRTKPHHAANFNHICDQTRTK